MGDSNCNIDLVEITIQNETLQHINLPERRILPQTGLTTVRKKIQQIIRKFQIKDQ